MINITTRSRLLFMDVAAQNLYSVLRRQIFLVSYL